MATLDPERERRFFESLEEMGRYFMGESKAQKAMLAITQRLEEAKIPYALVGGLSLGEYGHTRATDDVDILITREGLAAFKAAWLGRGYAEKFPGSKGVRDTDFDVKIDFLLAGEFPGDGKPKPVAFPEPRDVVERGQRVALLPIHRFVELKLASGQTAPHRIQDFADVVALVRKVPLKRELGQQLNPYVQAKYDELWLAAQHGKDDE